jgi:hypothetical protein
MPADHRATVRVAAQHSGYGRHGDRLYVTDGAGTVSVVDTRARTTVGAPIVLSQ